MAAPSALVLSFFGVGKAPEVQKLDDKEQREMSQDDAIGGGNVSTSNDELRWLIQHVKLLRLNSYDNAKRRYSVLMAIYKKLPRFMKILVITACAFAFFLILPIAVWMLINIARSKVAIIKMVLLYAFMAILTLISLLITI